MCPPPSFLPPCAPLPQSCTPRCSTPTRAGGSTWVQARGDGRRPRRCMLPTRMQLSALPGAPRCSPHPRPPMRRPASPADPVALPAGLPSGRGGGGGRRVHGAPWRRGRGAQGARGEQLRGGGRVALQRALGGGCGRGGWATSMPVRIAHLPPLHCIAPQAAPVHTHAPNTPASRTRGTRTGSCACGGTSGTRPSRRWGCPQTSAAGAHAGGCTGSPVQVADAQPRHPASLPCRLSGTLMGCRQVSRAAVPAAAGAPRSGTSSRWRSPPRPLPPVPLKRSLPCCAGRTTPRSLLRQQAASAWRCWAGQRWSLLPSPRQPQPGCTAGVRGRQPTARKRPSSACSLCGELDTGRLMHVTRVWTSGMMLVCADAGRTLARWHHRAVGARRRRPARLAAHCSPQVGRAPWTHSQQRQMLARAAPAAGALAAAVPSLVGWAAAGPRSLLLHSAAAAAAVRAAEHRAAQGCQLHRRRPLCRRCRRSAPSTPLLFALLMPQVEKPPHQAGSAEGAQKPFVQGDRLAEKREMRWVGCRRAWVLGWGGAVSHGSERRARKSHGSGVLRRVAAPQRSLCPPQRTPAWRCKPLSPTPPHESSPPRDLPPASESYEGVLHERSGTAEDVRVLDQARSSLGRCGRGGRAAARGSASAGLHRGACSQPSCRAMGCPALRPAPASLPPTLTCTSPSMTKDPRAVDRAYADAAREGVVSHGGRER